MHRFASLLIIVVALLCTRVASASASEAGLVAAINGTPSRTRAGTTEPLKRGDTVAVGDRIATDAESKVKILLADDSVLTIGSQTEVTIDELMLGPAGRVARLRVLFGRFKITIASWLRGSSDFEVATPTAVAGVRGTIVWGDTELDAICALEGSVEVRTVKGGATAHLTPGHCVTAMARGETVPLTPSAEELRKYLSQVTLD